ncbi:MAG: 1-acyl-sn-glycerol-3-phosphate acyltransferase [Rhodospirillales bacterium]|nr:MAG: 1-acyl-sn-glycerol-3-phosphate acyltransferase [Rhodospirillales bacterium]
MVGSVAFAIAFYGWTSALAVLYLPLLALPRPIMVRGVRLWVRGALWLARVLCGVRHRVVGRERVPPGAVVIAAKHQSAWDTLIFHHLLEDPVFAIKRELFAVPLFGWYLQKAGNIRIDRSSRVQALKSLVTGSSRSLAAGRQVVVFPEGTRVTPGTERPYQVGIAAVYRQCRAPVVPVALNSGLFWGRRQLRKRAGVITLEFLPPLPAGLDRDGVMDELRRRIETASERLRREAERPHSDHPPLGKNAGASPGQAGDNRRKSLR